MGDDENASQGKMCKAIIAVVVFTCTLERWLVTAASNIVSIALNSNGSSGRGVRWCRWC